MKLKGKVLSVSLSIIFIFVISIMVTYIKITSTLQNEEISSIKTMLMNEKREQIKNLIEIPKSLLAEIDKLDISREEKQKLFINKIEDVRYKGNEGYFFAFDLDGDKASYAFHGADRSLNGSTINLDDQDVKGNYFRRDLIKNSKNETFTSYFYKNPLTDKVEEKLALAYYYPKWNWYIGTGFYIDGITEQLNIAEKDTTAQINKGTKSFILIFVVIAFGVIISTLFFTQKLINPIKSLSDKFELLSNGDLTQEISIDTNDEIGDLSRNFVKFSQKIRETMTHIQFLAEKVESDNSELSKTLDGVINSNEEVPNGVIKLNEHIMNVLDNVRNQTAASEESLAALEEVSATSDSMKENIHEGVKAFDETSKKTLETLNSIREMNNKMDEIGSSVNESNKKVEELENLSGNIVGIVTAINSISEQTNLLALNAAIEAARAGEAGRGFAVVADEIRKLAEQTSNETDKIEDLIKSILSNVKEVRETEENVAVKVDEGRALMTQGRSYMEDISNLTKKNNEDLGQIVLAAEEQSSAAREIAIAVEQITNSSTEIEGLSHETTEISNVIRNVLLSKQNLIKELEEYTQKLKMDIGFFKV